jgi:hypothetical protein
VDSLRNETIVRDPSAGDVFAIRPRGYREALKRALANEDREFAETRWSDAFSSLRISPRSGGINFGRRIVNSRSVRVPFPPAIAFRPIERLGGKTGWYFGNWLWRIRGLLDLLFGGAGMRRSRRDPDRLFAGDTVDFWRVEEIRRDHLLRLAAEMRLPGRAWLQFEIEANGLGSVVRQTLSLIRWEYWGRPTGTSYIRCTDLFLPGCWEELCVLSGNRLDPFDHSVGVIPQRKSCQSYQNAAEST